MDDYNINPNDIQLIKMDIEGGEKIVIPCIIPFLQKYKPNFYISLHRVFITENDIDTILDLLFNVYKNCYNFLENNTRRKVNKQIIKKEQLLTLVFEK